MHRRKSQFECVTIVLRCRCRLWRGVKHAGATKRRRAKEKRAFATYQSSYRALRAALTMLGRALINARSPRRDALTRERAERRASSIARGRLATCFRIAGQCNDIRNDTTRRLIVATQPQTCHRALAPAPQVSDYISGSRVRLLCVREIDCVRVR